VVAVAAGAVAAGVGVVAGRPWTDEQRLLWARLQAHELDRDDAELCFSKRLARDNLWSMELTRRVICEYRRFVLLAMVAGHPVTPSDQVDQAWHLHLLYTRDYWGPFNRLLPRPLHHGPTLGGAQEGAKFSEWYARTRHSYLCWFGEHPPPDIWPSTDLRFGRDLGFRRVNLSTHRLVARDLPWWRRVLQCLVSPHFATSEPVEHAEARHGPQAIVGPL
jgi:hypothetical protein